MPSRLSWTLRVAFGALLTLALPLPAQQDPVPGESFGEAIDVSVVNLDVFVTSKKGKPVEGLTAEDFEVLEDGKPVKISNFYAEKGMGAAPAEAGTPAERPADQRLRLVIFVDDVNMEPAGRARILGSLDGFLRGELAPGDEVMLVRYNMKLDIRRSFTSDLGLVASDIADLVKMSSDLRKYDESRDHAVEDIIDAIYAGDGWGPLAEGRINAFAEQESAVVKGALDALDSRGELALRGVRPQGRPLRQRRVAAAAGRRPVRIGPPHVRATVPAAGSRRSAASISRSGSGR